MILGVRELKAVSVFRLRHMLPLTMPFGSYMQLGNQLFTADRSLMVNFKLLLEQPIKLPPLVRRRQEQVGNLSILALAVRMATWSFVVSRLLSLLLRRHKKR